MAALLLLCAAGLQSPAGLAGSVDAAHSQTPLYLAAALVGSVYIWWSALQGIRRGDFTADIPVSLATIAALAIGEYSAAAVVAALLLLGGVIEGLVAARSSRALDTLAKLLPDRVTVRRAGQDVSLPLSELNVGDSILVRPGERIAVDGTVLAGQAEVNQAAITGESQTVTKAPGDTVYAGTLSTVGALEIRADRVGEETTLGQIRRMVASAQARKAPIERLLDRWARLYTPAAILLGLVLWWWSGDMLRAITALIVFCPCVMVLATPTALAAAIGNAALRGTLIKKGATVEALARVNAIAFDKTGTLTRGALRVIEIVPLNGMSEQELLGLAAGAENYSEHPLGRAVVRAAGERGHAIEDPQSFAVLPGLGVRARVRGYEVVVGRIQWLAEQGVTLNQQTIAHATELGAAGRTVMLVARNGEAAGLLALADELRPEARGALEHLHRLGLRTILITGDSRVAAESVAAELGIDEVHAEVSPQGKAAVVEGLQAQGLRVAFVGDGVNDGPALAVADVGIAMGVAGTDVAVETAEIALLADDLSRLPQLLLLARQAIRAIRQNLVFSLAVLGIAILLTSAGVLTPVTGALLHELASLPVIANSARLIGAADRSGLRSSSTAGRTGCQATDAASR
ncbi:MAG: heavy metal translocating P-type ATPase [Thiobacillaceae bacterium]